MPYYRVQTSPGFDALKIKAITPRAAALAFVREKAHHPSIVNYRGVEAALIGGTYVSTFDLLRERHTVPGTKRKTRAGAPWFISRQRSYKRVRGEVLDPTQDRVFGIAPERGVQILRAPLTFGITMPALPEGYEHVETYRNDNFSSVHVGPKQRIAEVTIGVDGKPPKVGDIMEHNADGEEWKVTAVQLREVWPFRTYGINITRNVP